MHTYARDICKIYALMQEIYYMSRKNYIYIFPSISFSSSLSLLPFLEKN